MELSELFDARIKQIRYSQGSAFKAKGGLMVFMLAILLVIGIVVNSAKNHYLIAGLFIVFLVLAVGYLIDIRGLEVNHSTKKIRTYKSYLGFIYGEWFPFKNFKSIYLSNEHVVEDLTFGSVHSDRESITHHYYLLYLVDEVNNKSLLLKEFDNYYLALHQAEKIIRLSGLEFIDRVKGYRIS